jgi:hypothetical protein
MTESHDTPNRGESVWAEAARATLAELPDAKDNTDPYFWIGRLRMALEGLLGDLPATAPAGAGEDPALALLERVEDLDDKDRAFLLYWLADNTAARQRCVVDALAGLEKFRRVQAGAGRPPVQGDTL